MAPTELGDRKTNLVTDMQSWEQVKLEKLGMFSHAHCSLYLCSQKREREKLILLFSFSLQQKAIFSSRGFKFSDWHRTQALKRGAKKDKLTVNSRIKPMILSSLGIC